MKLLFFLLPFLSSLSINAAEFLPPDIDGWEQDGEVEVFERTNLFNHINGASEFYFSYNFQKVWVTRYKKGDAELTLEVYDHGDLAHAFGIYSMERPPEADVKDIGAQGYYEDAILNFVIDRYYVKMNSYREPGAGSGVLLNTANLVSRNLSDSHDLPEIVTLFPDESRVLNSRQFISNTFMGLEFLGSAFRARYQNEHGELTMFVMQRESAEEMKALLEKYLEFAGKKTVEPTEGSFVIEDPFNGAIHLTWFDKFVIGFSGDDIKVLRDELSTELKSKLADL